MKKIHLIPSVILFISVILTLIPFFKPGLFYVHDPTSAFRLYTLIDTIKSGQFPAAWSNALNFGFGYPLHLYYAPLFGYLGAVIFPFVQSYEIAVKIALFVASIVGTFGVYNLLLKYGRYPALLSAVAFTFLPYRASALYVRGSYSEFLAMSLFPWVIYFWNKDQLKIRTILSTAIVTSLFVLSHNTLPLLVIPVILLMIGLFQRKYLKGSALALLLTIGLTSWFILPIIFERNFVQVDMVARLTNFRDHFLFFSQLWHSPWGYGGSGRGIGEDHMSFMVGKGQLILALLGACALIYKKKWKLLSLYGVIIFISAFLSLDVSSFIWEKLHVLSIMQFPWRTLAVLGIGVSVLSGIGVILVPSKWQLPAVIVASSLLIYTNLGYFSPQEYRTYSKEILSSSSNLDPLVRDKIPEYLPVWMSSFPGSRIDDGLSRTTTSVTGTYTITTTDRITLSTAYMPQWRLTVDNMPVATTYDLNGLVTTEGVYDAGDHQIKLTWQRTWIENIGISLTLGTIILVIGLLVL